MRQGVNRDPALWAPQRRVGFVWSELREKKSPLSLLCMICVWICWYLSDLHLVQPCAWLSIARTCFASPNFDFLCCPEVPGSRTPEVPGCSSQPGSSGVLHQEVPGPINLTSAIVEKISGKPIHPPPLGYISARSLVSWQLWKERNSRIFDYALSSVSMIIDSIH